MSELQVLVEKLQDSEAVAEQMRKELAANPDDIVLRINAASVEKRRTDLARKLDQVLNVKQAELVRYRIMRDWTDAYPVKAVAAAMASFQELVTAIFDAIRTVPKLRYRPSIENEALSTFEFAGASAGSVVLSLAVPNDRLLVGETELDRTFQLVEQVLNARESEDLKSLADTIGVAAISKAYAWAAESATYGIDTEIQWGKSILELRELTISRDDALVVKDLIESKSETSESELIVAGVLLGFDGATSYFHLETLDDKRDIRGDLSPTLSKAWMTNQIYTAVMLRSAQIKYATGEEKEKFTLLRLEPLSPDRILE